MLLGFVNFFYVKQNLLIELFASLVFAKYIQGSFINETGKEISIRKVSKTTGVPELLNMLYMEEVH